LTAEPRYRKTSFYFLLWERRPAAIKIDPNPSAAILDL